MRDADWSVISGIVASVVGTRMRWRGLVLVLAAWLAVTTLPLGQARGAGPVTRLDWGPKAPIPTVRGLLGVAAAPNGLLYAVGGFFGGTLATSEAYDPATNTWTPRAPLPAPRIDFELTAALNGKLYAVGGIGDSGLGIPTAEYDPATDTWTSRAPLRDPRRFLGVAATPDGKLYAAGGSRDGIAGRTTLEQYDPTTDTWVLKAAMPTPRYGLGLAAAPNGKLYAVGGEGGLGGARVVVEEYDPIADSWRSRTPMPLAPVGVSLATGSNGRLYAIGNCRQTSPCSVVQEYDPASDTWTIKASPPTGISSFGMAAAPNGRLYVVGGFEASEPHGIVEEYDPQTDTWAGVRAAPVPSARLDAASAAAGGKLYVFGGQSGPNPTGTVFQYDPASNAWATMTPMPTGRQAAAAVTAGNGKIYVVGGTAGTVTPECLSFHCMTVEEYTPPTGAGGGTWRGAGNGISQLPVPRTALAMALGADGKLYATGGSDGTTVRAETYQYNPATNTAWLAMANMPQPRSELGLAPGGDGKLYAVGGNRGGALSTVERFVLPTAGKPQGSWEGPSGIPPLPLARSRLGVVGLPNGHILVAGGRLGVTPTSDVFEYDPATNAWTSRPPLLTFRFGLTLAVVGTRHVITTGGFDGANVLTSVQDGLLDEIPSVSISGGGFNGLAGPSVQLIANGSDPEGDRLTYAWDLDGSLLYTTPGQTVTFPTAGLSPGTRTLRVRALDTFGGYALASTTVTIQAPSVCNPRPSVAVTTRRVGSGLIQATISAQTSAATPNNTLQRIALTRIDNATASVNGSPVTAGSTVPFAAGTSQTTLLVQRQNTSAGATVAFTVADGCGEWKSFVGGGASAF